MRPVYRCIMAMMAIATFLPSSARQTLDLSGIWTVALDSTDTGHNAGWTDRAFETRMILPGTTDMAALGTPNTLAPALGKPQLLRLTRKFRYVGSAWYSREIDIPSELAGKTLDLKLERVIWASDLWIDGKKVEGHNESLTTPHYFHIPQGLTEGKHRITLKIDNRRQHNVSHRELAHAYTDDTQTKWNGVLGEITLSEHPDIAIVDTRIYPDINNKSIRIETTIDNRTGKSKKYSLTYSVTPDGQEMKPLMDISKTISLDPGCNNIHTEIKPGNDIKLWDEFSPMLYRLTTSIGKTDETAVTTFGMREIDNHGGSININGCPVFLRGTLECCVFPLTGTPPTDDKGWETVFTTARQWGLNHLRFHSWCPPDAAFRVADRMGFYLQVELPCWSETLTPGDTDTQTYLRDEYNRIIKEYGNHPSLCLLSVGNEIRHDFDWLNSLVAYMKQHDPRHLYTTSSFTFEPGHGKRPEPEDQYFVTQWTADGWVRGQGVFDTEPPSFNKNYASAMPHIDRPLISHEIGQYAVYPDLSEIEKYTGVLEPLNFKAVQNDMAAKGLSDRAATYTEASGRFAALLYKEEIERAMKTPGFSGFQLLGLQDFPGQGTALVGLVNAFWESKGIIEPQQFREFCSATVPLANFEKAVYSGNERFYANIDLFNFSTAPVIGPKLRWTLTDGHNTIDGGTITGQTAPAGKITSIGSIQTGFSSITHPCRLELSVEETTTGNRNRWSIWYYPDLNDTNAGNIVVTRDVNTALSELSAGNKVLYTPHPDSIKGLQCKFLPVFWSPVHFPRQAAGMGIFCNPAHQAFKSFPTDMHTDWQWWNLLKRATTMNLDSISDSTITPIVGMIDNFVNNRNLGLVFEAQCGKGSIIISSIDLMPDPADGLPEIKWFRQSLLDYMNSPAFAPASEISPRQIMTLTGAQAAQKRFGTNSIYEH